MTISIQKILPDQVDKLSALIDVYEDAFEMQNFKKPDTGYLQTLLHDKTILFFVAILDTKVIGGLTAHILPSTYFTAGSVYLFDLAVQTSYQRQGVGKLLLMALQDYCSGLGFAEIFVQADIEDQHALDFYRATGGVSEKVIHFTYTLQKSK